MKRRDVLVCLPTCGHGRGNRARLSGRAASPSMRPLGVYIYAVGPQSCRIHRAQKGSARLGPTKLRFCAKTLFLGAFRSAFGFAPQNATRFSAVTRPRPWPRMAPLVEFGAVLGGSASLTLPAAPLPPSSRRYAPQCFVGGYASSPCDVSHRAYGEPRRRMSLSSALAPSSLASPYIRRVSFRSFCARRRPVVSLNLATRNLLLTGRAAILAAIQSAALETAFGMGERRDVWYNMRMKGSVKTTHPKSPRQEDGVRSGWKTTGMA